MNLKELKISANRLTELPACFTLLPALEELVAIQNQISVIPRQFYV